MSQPGSSWTAAEIDALARTDDLHIAPFRDDGHPGTPTWIWSVVVDGQLYVRAYNGVSSSWFSSAQQVGAGLIRAAGSERPVSFHVLDGTGSDPDGLRSRVDQAYAAKYSDSPYVAPMTSDRAAAATVRVDPRR